MRVTTDTLHASAARTATGNGSTVHITGDSGVMFIDCSAASGTTPTLDVKLQGYDPISGNWFDTGDSFTQLTTTGSERVEVASLPDADVRVVYTIGGTSPSFTFSVSFVSKEAF